MGKIRPVKTVNIFDKTISKDFPSILRKVRKRFFSNWIKTNEYYTLKVSLKSRICQAKKTRWHTI